MNGDEDSTIEDCNIFAAPGATGVTAVDWEVPAGNLHIFGSTWFVPMTLQYQTADITGSTIGPITVGATAISLTLTAPYMYAGTVGSANGNFISSTTNGFGHIIIDGGYILGSTNAVSLTSSIAFQGAFHGLIEANGVGWDAGLSSSYALVSGATVPASGTFPALELRGFNFFGSVGIGTPASNFSVQYGSVPASTLMYASFPLATSAQTGPVVIHSFPIKLTGISAVSTQVATGCATAAVVSISGISGTSLTLANGAAQWGSFNLNVAIPQGAFPNINVTTGASGCSTAPANLQVTVELQPQ